MSVFTCSHNIMQLYETVIEVNGLVIYSKNVHQFQLTILYIRANTKSRIYQLFIIRLIYSNLLPFVKGLCCVSWFDLGVWYFVIFYFLLGRVCCFKYFASESTFVPLPFEVYSEPHILFKTFLLNHFDLFGSFNFLYYIW